MKRKVLVLVGALVVMLTLVVAASAAGIIPQEYADVLADTEGAASADFQSTVSEEMIAEMVEYAKSMEDGQPSEILEME